MPPAGAVSIARKVPKPEPEPERRILLVRHGHTALNSEEHGQDRIRGWVDVPLDAEGKKEAAALAAMFEGCEADLVITSDLSRAADTARGIARETGAKLTETRQLRPWNLGDYQGKPTASVIPHLHKEYVRAHPADRVPGGESFNQFKTRFLDCLKDVLGGFGKEERTIILVAHYRNLKTAQAWLAAGAEGETLDMKTFLKDDLHPGAILLIRPGPPPEGEILFHGFQAGDRAGASASQAYS